MKKIFFLTPLLLPLLTACGTPEYYCLKGYVFNEADKTCVRTVVEEASINYYCEGKNETIDGQKCKKANISPATPTKVCNPGFYVEGSLCIKEGTVANISKCGSARTFNKADGRCYDKIPAVTTYQCKEGTPDGSTCVVFTYSDALTEYVCDDPKYKLNTDNKCEYVITMNAKNVKED